MTDQAVRDRYTSLRVGLHWLAVALVGFMLATGFAAAATTVPEAKRTLLQLHASVGAVTAATAMLMLLARITGTRIARLQGTGIASRVAASSVQVSLLLALIATAVAGATTLYLSGAFEIVFGDAAPPFPDFFKFSVRRLHGVGARLLILLILIHSAAALYHQFVRRRPIFRRIAFKVDSRVWTRTLIR